MRFRWQLTILVVIASLFACQANTVSLPTRAARAPTVPPTPQPVVAVAASPVPATWTPPPELSIVSPTPGALPSRTPRPTNSPWPTETATIASTATDTLTPEPTLSPTPTPFIVEPSDQGGNLLTNPSFEEGWHHINGIPELQVANGWILEWDVGYNPLDPDPWNRFVRPESRVLNGDFLPADEHDLFIWDGAHTVKIFKRTGALSFRLMTDVFLQPGTYQFEISFFPDLVDDYTENGTKIWAPDPLSGEVRFIVDSQVGTWMLPRFGQKNTLRWTFDVVSPQTMRLGVAFRGRWAILNNGWFMDDWSVYRIS